MTQQEFDKLVKDLNNYSFDIMKNKRPVLTFSLEKQVRISWRNFHLPSSQRQSLTSLSQRLQDWPTDFVGLGDYQNLWSFLEQHMVQVSFPGPKEIKSWSVCINLLLKNISTLKFVFLDIDISGKFRCLNMYIVQQ